MFCTAGRFCPKHSFVTVPKWTPPLAIEPTMLPHQHANVNLSTVSMWVRTHRVVVSFDISLVSRRDSFHEQPTGMFWSELLTCCWNCFIWIDTGITQSICRRSPPSHILFIQLKYTVSNINCHENCESLIDERLTNEENWRNWQIIYCPTLCLAAEWPLCNRSLAIECMTNFSFVLEKYQSGVDNDLGAICALVIANSIRLL